MNQKNKSNYSLKFQRESVNTKIETEIREKACFNKEFNGNF